jgi:RecJ-like exonuclease
MKGSTYLGAMPPEVRQTTLNAAIGKITPTLEAVYKEAERQTGVPCEVLAGIHFVEANNRANGSLISGRAIGVPEPDQGGKIYSSLLETAVDAAKVLKVKAGLPKDTYAEFTSAEQLITALSDYNGKGNRNCQDSYTVNGAVVKIPYTGCPALFKGEDHPSVMNWLDSKHATMYLLYCADYTACAPQVWNRPGYSS